MAWDKKVPFEGNRLVCHPWPRGNYEWRDAVPFDAVLEVVSWEATRSNIRVNVRNTDNGERYSMSATDFFTHLTGHEISGRFNFKKMGRVHLLTNEE
jgi:hypothetical protein